MIGIAVPDRVETDLAAGDQCTGIEDVDPTAVVNPPANPLAC